MLRLARVVWRLKALTGANESGRNPDYEPRYSVAQLLRQVITAGTPPSLARLPMTPEEVAASYSDLDDELDSGDDHDQDPDAHDPDPACEQ